jgi:aminopeptidase N
VLDRRTPVDLAAWSRVWVESAGRLVITTELDVQDAASSRSPLQPTRSIAGPVAAAAARHAGAARRPRTIEVALNGARTVVAEAAGPPAPSCVLPNGGGWAYGGFVLDRARATTWRRM